jgi:hypothetical protein
MEPNTLKYLYCICSFFVMYRVRNLKSAVLIISKYIPSLSVYQKCDATVSQLQNSGNSKDYLFLDFAHRLILQKKYVSETVPFPSSGGGRHLLCWVP